MAQRILRWLFLLAVVLPAPAADCCKGTVAVIETATGKVTMRPPSAATGTAVSGLEWVTADSILEVGHASTATLLLINGHRYELGAGSRATVTADGLSSVRGPVRELKPLPPLPKFVPIADGGDSAPGAVRFRGPNDPQNLYPHAGTAALPSSLTLRFSPVLDATAYDITLEDESGDVVLQERTVSVSLEVPPEKLRTGAHYSWHVRAIGSAGELGKGVADFVTLSPEDVEQRTHFAEALGETAEASRLALLADVDLRLGLLAEARAEFEAALRLKPDDAAIRRTLESVLLYTAGKSAR